MGDSEDPMGDSEDPMGDSKDPIGDVRNPMAPFEDCRPYLEFRPLVKTSLSHTTTFLDYICAVVSF